MCNYTQSYGKAGNYQDFGELLCRWKGPGINKLPRFGRPMLECMEILSLAFEYVSRVYALKCYRQAIFKILWRFSYLYARWPKSLIVLVKSEKYHEHKETDHKFINKSVVVIMSANGEIRAVQKLPIVIKNAADKMKPHHRCDVMDCYDMVLKHL